MTPIHTTLITGSTDGIGLETAKQLVSRNHDIIVHGRDKQRVQLAWEKLQSQATFPLSPPIVADLSSLKEVRLMAAALSERNVKPSILINNAGVYMHKKVVTADGLESTIAINHFAPFLLTHLLLAQADHRLKRIVNVSSIAHQRGKLSLDDMACTGRPFDPYGLYAASKLANVLFTVELAKRLTSKNVLVFSLHPGVVSTKLLTEGFGMQGNDTLEQASATSVMLASTDGLEQQHGQYFVYGKVAAMSKAVQDVDFVSKYYEQSAQVTDVRPH